MEKKVSREEVSLPDAEKPRKMMEKRLISFMGVAVGLSKNSELGTSHSGEDGR